jgi:hypothetical protein
MLDVRLLAVQMKDPTPVDGVKLVIRALAELRDGPFYGLWVDLTYLIKHPLPRIDVRVFRIGDCTDAVLGVSVSAQRADGKEVSWSLQLETATDSLLVTASVSICGDDDPYSEVFNRSASTSDVTEAVALMRRFAHEVCSERQWSDASFEK